MNLTTTQTWRRLEWPVDILRELGPGCDYLVYQTVDQRPIVGGYLARTPSRVLALYDLPFIQGLRYRIPPDDEPNQFPPEAWEHGLRDVQSLKVEYVVQHKNLAFLTDADLAAANQALLAILGHPVYEDYMLIAWHVPGVN